VTIHKKNEDGSLELEAGNRKIKINADLAMALLAEPVSAGQLRILLRKKPPSVN